MSAIRLVPTSWHVGVAAEAIAAAQFARCGCDVSVQYGANQPEYDLIVARDDRLLKVSVKGSQEGAWGLTQSLLRDGNYHGAADSWLKRHGTNLIFCLVQFQNIQLNEMPRIYLARPSEIAARLKASRSGVGDTILYEDKKWGSRAVASGTVDRIPDEWRFTAERLSALLHSSEITRS